jgi:hypothetical protein
VRWGWPEGVILILLVAAGVRIAVSLASGAINGYVYDGSVSAGAQWGNILLWAAGFADGLGLVAPLGALVLLWWSLDRWTAAYVPDGPPEWWPARHEAYVHLRRLRTLSTWLLVVLGVSAAAAVLLAVSSVLIASTENLSLGAEWEHYLGDGGFDVAYALMYLAGFVVVARLRRRTDVASQPTGLAPPGLSVPYGAAAPR